jgi:gliding motility-associated-like protein
VTIEVGPTPDANDDVVTTDEDVPVTIPVLDNDTDVPTSGTITVVTPPTSGTVVINDGGTPDDPSDDTITYTPNPGYSGTDTFEYTICDASGNCDTATVTIQMFPAPDAGDDFVACLNEGGILLSGNDVGGTWSTNSAAVIVTPNDPNTEVRALQPGGVYEFYWTVPSADGGTMSDTVVVTVPQMPVALADTYEVYTAQPTDLEVVLNDTLRDGNVTVSIVSDPANGSAFVNGDFSITYESNTGYVGRESFIYEVCLAECPSMCDTAVVNMVVIPELTIPDVITPDGNGVNDAFVIKGLEDNFPRNELYVYNRWGNEVYSSVDYRNDWEGTYKGQTLPAGTYFYILINRDTGEEISHGYLTLHK